MLRRSLIVHVVLAFAVRAEAAPAPSKACSATKVTASAKALVCLAGEQNKILLSRSGDVSKCTIKLANDFARAEARANGACPTTGDAAAVGTRASTAEGNVLTALMAGSVSTKAQLACLVAENAAAARYASCQARAMSKRLTVSGAPRSFDSDFARCRDKIGRSFLIQARRGGCLDFGDEFTIGGLVSPVGSYLPDANLAFARLPDAELRGATLIDATLSGAKLTNANLDGADLSGASFTGSDLTFATVTAVVANGANFAGADLFTTDLSSANLHGADLAGANLDSAKLDEADLTGADLAGADMHFASLFDADLTDADLSNAHVAGGYLFGVELSGATLTGADLSDANLAQAHAVGVLGCPASLPSSWTCIGNALIGPSADLIGADLSGVNLSGAILTDADLESADLDGATLTNAIFSYALLTGASFTGADLTGVVWFHTECPDGTLSSTNGSDPESCCAHMNGSVPASCSP